MKTTLFNSAAISRFCAIATALTSFTIFLPNSVIAGYADVALTLYGPRLDVITNDHISYTIALTNFGPSTATNVVVTNLLPSGFALLDATPSHTYSSGTLTFNFGNLTNLATRVMKIQAKPANAGNFTLSASASSTGSIDWDTANNTSSNAITVGKFLAGSLTAKIDSAMEFSALNMLDAQWIRISNSGPSTVYSSRIVVTGITNRLFNASGTNNGVPFVVCGTLLEPGQTARVCFWFVSPSQTPFDVFDSQFSPFPTAKMSFTPPGDLGEAMSPRRVIRLSSSGTAYDNCSVLEFPSHSGTNYSILYADNPEFANPQWSPDSFVATANFTDWIDCGPPATVSFPTNTHPRYYRVYPNLY